MKVINPCSYCKGATERNAGCGWVFVSCSGCGARGPRFRFDFDAAFERGEDIDLNTPMDQAIDHWNQQVKM